MTYQELLLDNRWEEKRLGILEKYSLKCQDCLNKEYENNFESGLIISTDMKDSNSPIPLFNDYYIVSIWDTKNNIITKSFISKDTTFSIHKSHVAYYGESGGSYPKIYALKIIDNSNIEIINDVLEIARLGIKGKFSEKTRKFIEKEVDENDYWIHVKGLHVHHNYYQDGLLPWEYPDSALTTLCWSCHEKKHQNKKIPVYNIDGKEKGKYTYCLRCHGAGIFPEYRHIEAGICFRCHGARYEELIY